MNSLNSVLIEGNLISDPILENNICKFSICSDRFYKNENNDLIKEIYEFWRLLDSLENCIHKCFI